jgi:flavin reductase (DIM6/NTAB) family NADH-FMN oxidoreductase RutF
MTHDPRELRNTLGQFATGVCLITVVDGAGRSLALTANSFSSVSLDPPLVLWSLQCNSEVYDAFVAPPCYAINVLARSQEGLSSRYAKKGDHVLDPSHYEAGDNGAPLVRDALAFFECSLETTHEGGDHTIIVGRVTRFSAAAKGDPLLFYGGSYRSLS